MRSLLVFMKKEALAHLRSPKPFIMLATFVLIGIMNPLMTKLTPLLFEILEESGMVIQGLTVSALESWAEFFANIPLALMAFILIEGNIFTKEYQSGTLVLALAKGLKRYKVIVANTVILIILWSVCYWLSYGITYIVTAAFWDNSIAANLGFAAFLWWFFGVFTIALLVLSSAVFNSYGGVLLGTGGVVALFYILMLIPKVNKFFPTMLTDGASLVYALAEVKDYVPALFITLALSVAAIIAAIPILNKKQL